MFRRTFVTFCLNFNCRYCQEYCHFRTSITLPSFCFLWFCQISSYMLHFVYWSFLSPTKISLRTDQLNILVILFLCAWYPKSSNLDIRIPTLSEYTKKTPWENRNSCCEVLDVDLRCWKVFSGIFSTWTLTFWFWLRWFSLCLIKALLKL